MEWIGYFVGLFLILVGGIGHGGCGGVGGWIGVFLVLIVVFKLSFMYSSFNIHNGCCLAHGFWQGGLHLGW